jgi:hypothetical protein
MRLETGFTKTKMSRDNSCVRRYPRYPFTVPVTLRRLLGRGFETNRATMLDLGRGGIGAVLPHALRVGEAVELDFVLPSGPIHVLGIVRYSLDQQCGFEFLGLTAEEKERIAAATHVLSLLPRQVSPV